MKNEMQGAKKLKRKFLMFVVIIVFVSIIALLCLLVDGLRSMLIGNAIEIIVISALLLYVIHMQIVLERKNREILEESTKKVENYEQILIAVASDTSKGIRTVNLENGRCNHFYFKNNKIIVDVIGDWEKWLVTQTKNVNPDDYDSLYSNLCMSRLNTMKEGITTRINYRSRDMDEQGFFRHYTTTVSITYIDDMKTAVLTTIENTDVIMNELKQKKLLESAASIYISMQDIDIDNDKLQTISCAEHIFEVIGYETNDAQHNMCNVIRKLVDERYINDVLEFIDLRTLDERMAGVRTISMEFIGKVSGWCRGRFIAVSYNEDGTLSHVLWLIKDIDDERKKSNQLKFLSETDQMTKISNRGAGENKIKEYLEKDHQGMFCVLDVDEFKSINDTFGHGVGDKVLIEIARGLKESFSEKDVVMRLGGDEFAVFADGIIDKSEAENIIKKVIDRIDNIYIRELEDRKITISIGAAFKLRNDGIDFEDLYRNADNNTYNSKKTHGSCYTL